MLCPHSNTYCHLSYGKTLVIPGGPPAIYPNVLNPMAVIIRMVDRNGELPTGKQRMQNEDLLN